MDQQVSTTTLTRYQTFIAGKILIGLPAFIGVLLLAIIGCSSPSKRQERPVLTSEELAAVLPNQQLSDDQLRKQTGRITIAGVGDIMLGTDFPENHLPDDDGIAFLRDVTP
ncbi:uncharacterized protein METZ01_LOCUS308933, partial [marine metagenome]